MTTIRQATPLTMTYQLAQRRLVLAGAAFGFNVICAWEAFVVADQPQPINRLGRVLGEGYSDGYHTCQSTGTRLLADLPPRSYTHQGDVSRHNLASASQQRFAGFATYYDQFDHACDPNQGCVTHGMQPETLMQPQLMPEPLMSESVLAVPEPSTTPHGIDLRGNMNFSPAFDPVAEANREMEDRRKELEDQKKMLAEQERYRQFQVFEKLRQREDDLEDGSTPLDELAPLESETDAEEDFRIPSSSDLKGDSAKNDRFQAVQVNPLAASSIELAPSRLPNPLTPNPLVPTPESKQDLALSTRPGVKDSVALTEPLKTTWIRQPVEEDGIVPADEPERRIASGDWLIIRQPK